MSITAEVVVLSFAICPAAVLRAIVAVRIDTVKRMVRSGLVAHVIEEILKAMEPSFADGNTSTPVVRVRDVGLGIATGFHRGPCAVLRRAGKFVCGYGIDLQATTATGYPRHEVATVDDSSVSALATAKPSNMPAFVGCTFDDGPSTKSLTCKVQKSRHSLPSFNYQVVIRYCNTRVWRVQHGVQQPDQPH